MVLANLGQETAWVHVVNFINYSPDRIRHHSVLRCY